MRKGYNKKMRSTKSGYANILLVFLAVFVASFAIFGIRLAAQNKNVTSQSPSVGKISWEPSNLSVTVFPGDTKIKDVQFTAQSDLSNMNAWVVPELAGMVTVKPNTFSYIKSGSTQSIHLMFTVPTGTPFSSNTGTLHLRQDNNTIAQPLKLTINIGVPPDPGTAGKQTLAGIDSDGDGVRDDIQRYIGLTYPDSAKTRAALSQYAIATQNFILKAGDKAGSLASSKEQDKSIDCLYSIRPGDTYKIWPELRAIFLNTIARSKAYIKADSQLSGEVFTTTPDNQKKSQCSFNVDLMHN